MYLIYLRSEPSKYIKISDKSVVDGPRKAVPEKFVCYATLARKKRIATYRMVFKVPRV